MRLHKVYCSSILQINHYHQLADIVMTEEEWSMPNNYEEALDLYIKLVHEIQ